jgi:hypothetical protein
MNIREALSHHLEITVLTFDTVKKYYEKTKLPDLEKLLNDLRTVCALVEQQVQEAPATESSTESTPSKNLA